MKNFVFALAALAFSTASLAGTATNSQPATPTNKPAAADLTGTYGLHLYFNEKEFVDVVTLQRDARGALTGHMSVPDDFEADLLDLEESDGLLTFDLPVPKNASRPVDLMFHYEARLFDASGKQSAGFVTLKGEKDFVASFVMFRR